MNRNGVPLLLLFDSRKQSAAMLLIVLATKILKDGNRNRAEIVAMSMESLLVKTCIRHPPTMAKNKKRFISIQNNGRRQQQYAATAQHRQQQIVHEHPYTAAASQASIQKARRDNSNLHSGLYRAVHN